MEVLVPSQTLLEKLQLKDEKNVLVQGLPSTVEKQFAKLSFSKNVTPLLKSRKIDFALIFAISQRQLADILKEVLPALNTNAKLWISYPKLTSKIVSDLSRECNWDCLSKLGFESVRVIAVDNVWTATRFKKADQIQRNSSSEVVEEYIETATRNVSLPTALSDLFEEHIEAREFFDGLSFSNKKEYLVWITGAKKEETKLARLQATIDKLNKGKRNPSEK